MSNVRPYEVVTIISPSADGDHRVVSRHEQLLGPVPLPAARLLGLLVIALVLVHPLVLGQHRALRELEQERLTGTEIPLSHA